MIKLLFANAATKAVHTDQINDMMLTSMKTIIENTQAWPTHIFQLTVYLILIEVAVFIIYQMFKPELIHIMRDFLPRLLKIIVVVVITSSYPTFTSAIMGYVVGHGGGGAGQTSVTSKGFNPAAVASSGIEKVSIVFDKNKRENIIHSFIGNEKKKTPVKVESDFFGLSATMAEDASEMIEMTVLGMLAFGLFLFLAIIVIMVHFYVAAMIFVFTMEFYIVVSITSCFLPFGINKHTSYLFTGAINAVIAQSVKLAVLAAVLGLLGDPLATMSFADKVTLPQVLSMVAVSMTVAFMVHRVPAIASAVFPGGGNGINLDSILSAATGKALEYAQAGAKGAADIAAGAASQAMPNMPDLAEAAQHMQSGAEMFFADGREQPLPEGQPDHPMAGGLSLAELVPNNDPIDRASSSGAEAGQPGGLDMYAKDNESMAQGSLPDTPFGGRETLQLHDREIEFLGDREAIKKPDLSDDPNDPWFFHEPTAEDNAIAYEEMHAELIERSMNPSYGRFDDMPEEPQSFDDGPPNWGDVPISDDAPVYDEPEYDPSYDEDYGDDH